MPHTGDFESVDVSSFMCQVPYVIRHMSCVTCHLSQVKCHLLCVTCHMSLMQTATAMDPPPANSLTMHSRMVGKDPRINVFHTAILGQFNSE